MLTTTTRPLIISLPLMLFNVWMTGTTNIDKSQGNLMCNLRSILLSYIQILQIRALFSGALNIMVTSHKLHQHFIFELTVLMYNCKNCTNTLVLN
jgi:hypothetical protein